MKIKPWKTPDGHEPAEAGFNFWCPGCNSPHGVWTLPASKAWGFDGNHEAPTFTPSILVTKPGNDAYRCHSYVRSGLIEFLSDCNHALAGKTVPIPEWPWE